MSLLTKVSKLCLLLLLFGDSRIKRFNQINMEKIASRSRAPNFTKEEQILLCKVSEPYTRIIESKKTDSVKHIQKQEVWTKVAEIYNANTKYVPRSVENLISCYRNMKSKLKKQYSDAKMSLEDSSQKQDLIIAMESHGKDWEEVGKIINEPPQVCEQIFLDSNKDLKKKESQLKKNIMGTGGGPPSPDTNPLDKIKKFIEPQIDGMFTMYDGDALLMKQYQESIPEIDRILPIESAFDRAFVVPQADDNVQTIKEDNKNIICEVEIHAAPGEPKILSTPQHKPQLRPIINRTDILRKKRSSALICDDNVEEPTPKKQKNVNDSFINLSQHKLELVKLQMMSLEMDIQHKKKVQELELEDLLKHNKHKEEMRQKELMLINLKIENIRNNKE